MANQDIFMWLLLQLMAIFRNVLLPPMLMLMLVLVLVQIFLLFRTSAAQPEAVLLPLLLPPVPLQLILVQSVARWLQHA